MTEGTVLSFDAIRGFGYIRPLKGQKIYFNLRDVVGGQQFSAGDQVKFEIATGNKGQIAHKVTLIAKASRSAHPQLRDKTPAVPLEVPLPVPVNKYKRLYARSGRTSAETPLPPVPSADKREISASKVLKRGSLSSIADSISRSIASDRARYPPKRADS